MIKVSWHFISIESIELISLLISNKNREYLHLHLCLIKIQLISFIQKKFFFFFFIHLFHINNGTDKEEFIYLSFVHIDLFLRPNARCLSLNEEYVSYHCYDQFSLVFCHFYSTFVIDNLFSSIQLNIN